MDKKKINNKKRNLRSKDFKNILKHFDDVPPILAMSIDDPGYRRRMLLRNLKRPAEHFWAIIKAGEPHGVIDRCTYEERAIIYRRLGPVLENKLGSVNSLYVYVRIFGRYCARTVIDSLLKNITDAEQARNLIEHKEECGLTDYDCYILDSIVIANRLSQPYGARLRT